MQVVICNTSPLQYLHQAKLVRVLPELFESVQIPSAVADEINQGRRYGIDLPEIQRLPWLSIKSISENSLISQFTNLGRGEKEVIILGLKSANPLLVIDDRKARRYASSAGLEVTGTMGILVLAKKRGLIDSVKAALDHLQRLQFRMDNKARQVILDLANEEH